MNRYTIYTRTLIAAATLALAAGCNELNEPDSPGKGMNIKPVFNTEITSSATKAGDVSETLTLEPLILDDGTQIDMRVTKDAEWPIAGPQDGAVLTKGTVYSGAAAYEAKSFRLSAWNASQSSSVLFAAKEYTCDAQHNWSTSQPPVWPMSSDNLAFVGLWDSSESAAASIVSGKYAVSNWDVSGNYADQKDLRAAFATYPADHNGDALLYFNPYMNAIRVKVGDLPSSYSVTKVELKGVGVKGTLVFPDTYTPALPVSSRDSYVGDWQNVTTGNLSLTGNWASGASVTPDGTAYLIIDPDGSTLAGSIEVTFKDSFGNTTVKSKNLSALGTDVKCGEAFTINIGSTFNYTFTLVNTGDATQTFNNTTRPLTKLVAIRSTVRIDGGTENPADWEIQSVQIGSGTPQEINDESFSDIGGYSASRSGNTLTLTSSARTLFSPGCHDNWTNKDGISGDTAGSGWSPKSWGSDGENKGTIDLSKYDFQNETTNNPMTTANCYVIRHAGTYKLPLVYGNGIVNGAFNVQSYAPTMAAGGNSSYFLSPIKNHLDNGIFSPFIEYNTRNGNPSSSNYIMPSGSQIMWQDDADIITIDGISKESVTVKNASGVNETFSVSYLTFTIPQDKICQNNALLAVTDSEGNIIWSWHIWTTNDPGLLKPAIPVKNQANNIYNFFPLPCLGWIEEGFYPARDIQIVLEQKRNGNVPKNTITLTVHQPDINSDSPNGCYYQFGRKDPMCRKDTPAYNHSDRPFNRRGVGKVSLADAIMHPEVLLDYGGSGFYDWCQPESGKTSYYNLWSGGYCGTGLIEGSQAGLSKTVYDPSPRGYMMPASNAFTGFTSTGSNTTTSSQFNVVGDFDKGWNFYTEPNGSSGTPAIFFPAAGYRNVGGTCLNIGYIGYYWSAVPGSTNFGRNQYFSSSGIVSPVNNSHYRSYGFSARPVQE